MNFALHQNWSTWSLGLFEVVSKIALASSLPSIASFWACCLNAWAKGLVLLSSPLVSPDPDLIALNNGGASMATDLLKLMQVKGVLTNGNQVQGIVLWVCRFQKCLWEPYRLEKIFYSEIGLSQANFIVKFAFQYIELPYTFLESTNIIEHCPELDFLWSEVLWPMQV